MNRPTIESRPPLIRPDLRRERVAIDWSPPADGAWRARIQGAEDSTPITESETLIAIAPGREWSHTDPALHILEIYREDSDEILHAIPFGMRELSLKENRFFLNTHPLKLCALGWRELSPPDNAALALLKKSGFNALSIRGDRLSDDLLAYCDEAGILLVVELDEDLAPKEAVERWGNHASVALWVDTKSTELRVKALREADSSRTIFACRGGRWGYSRPYRDEFVDFESLDFQLNPPMGLTTQRYLRCLGDPQEFTWLCIDAQPGEREMDRERFHQAAGELAKTFDTERMLPEGETLQDLLHSYARNVAADVLAAAMGNADIAGYIWYPIEPLTEANAVVWSRAQSTVQPQISISRINLIPREEVPIAVSLLNNDKLEGHADLSLQVVGPTKQVLWKKKRNIKIPRSGREIWSGRIEASGSPGIHRFIVRLLGPTGLVGESSLNLYVHKEAKRWEHAVNIVDPAGQWILAINPWVSELSLNAPIHIVPPLANTIGGYPDNDLAQVMGAVHDGAVALIFSPPDDWNDFAEFFTEDIRATSRSVAESAAAVATYARLHPVFEDLPAPGLLSSTYAGIAPRKYFQERSEEDIAGAIRFESASADATVGPTVLVRRYGDGRLVFIHFRVLERLDADPVAEKFFVNLLRHFSRRSVPSGGSLRINARAVEWMRAQRTLHLRRWMLLGIFSNENGAGHNTAFPPEEAVDLTASYPGWYNVCTWKTRYTPADSSRTIAPFEAVASEAMPQSPWRHGTIYAYTDLHAEDRGEAILSVRHAAACKVWLNGQLAYDKPVEKTDAAADTETTDTFNILPTTTEVDAFLRQGRNTLLVKLTYQGEEDLFTCNLARKDGADLIRWSR